MEKLIKTFFTTLIISTCIYFLMFVYIKREEQLNKLKSDNAVLNNKLEQLRLNNQKKIKKELLIKKIVECESGGDKEKWGDLNYDYPAFGICQMQQRTFDWLSKKANFKGDWRNSNHQIHLLRYAIDNGYGNLWTCYKKIKKEESI